MQAHIETCLVTLLDATDVWELVSFKGFGSDLGARVLGCVSGNLAGGVLNIGGPLTNLAVRTEARGKAGDLALDFSVVLTPSASEEETDFDIPVRVGTKLRVCSAGVAFPFTTGSKDSVVLRKSARLLRMLPMLFTLLFTIGDADPEWKYIQAIISG